VVQLVHLEHQVHLVQQGKTEHLVHLVVQQLLVLLVQQERLVLLDQVVMMEPQVHQVALVVVEQLV
jgi:hypothetical protein